MIGRAAEGVPRLAKVPSRCSGSKVGVYCREIATKHGEIVRFRLDDLPPPRIIGPSPEGLEKPVPDQAPPAGAEGEPELASRAAAQPAL